MGKNITKKQHYVPQFYLRNFSKNQKHLFAFNKSTGESFQENIKQLGQEKFFYEVPEIEENKEIFKQLNLDEKTAIEDYLKHMDGFCSKNIKNALNRINASRTLSKEGKHSFYLSNQEKINLAYFAALQEARTREKREKITQVNTSIFQKLLDKTVSINPPPFDIEKHPIKIDFNNDYHIGKHAQLILDEEHLNGLARIYTFTKIWRLGINKTDVPLIVSDHPIVKRPYYDSRSNKFIDRRVPPLEICIPLSPNLIISLLPSEVLSKSFKYGLEWHLDQSVFELTEEDINNYNKLQCASSHRLLFSSQNNWSKVTEFLNQNPNYKDPNRLRTR